MIGGTMDVTSSRPAQANQRTNGYSVPGARNQSTNGARAVIQAKNSHAGGVTGLGSGDRVPRFTRSTHVMEDGKLVFKRYDENGRLIQRVPPGYVPVSEMA